MKRGRGLEAIGLFAVLALAVPACSSDESTSAAGVAGSGGRGSAGRSSGGATTGGRAGAGGTGGTTGGRAGSANAAGDGGEAGDGDATTGGASGRGGGKGGGAGTSGGTSGTTGDAGNGGEGGETPTGPVRDPRCDDATASALQGSGTALDPYLLCLAEQIALLDTGPYTLDQNYELGDNLDFDDFTGTFTTFGTPFTGVLDGRSHAVTHLPTALFTDVSNPGEIVDLSVSGDVDASMESAGWGLLTRTNGGTVRRVHASGTLIVAAHAGILLGINSGLVEDCSSSGAITNGAAHVGGLIGVNTGTVRRCFSTASVTAVRRTGGLVGRQTEPGLIEQSYATGPVTDPVAPGGLLGTFFSGEIRNCYARSTLVSGPEAGGLVGDISGSAGDGLSRIILNSYSASVVSGAGAEGLVGNVELDPTFTITSSYFLDTATGTNGTPLTNAEMGQTSSYDGWAFGSVWKMDAALSPFPSLGWETP